MTKTPQGRTLLLTVAITLILLFGNLPFGHGANTNFFARLMDAGHFPLFAAITIVLVICGIPVSVAAVGLLVFDGAVELIQPYFHRSESSVDFFNGLLGVVLGVVLVKLWRARAGAFAFGCVLLLSAGCSVILLLPAYREWQAIEWRAAHFPILATFSDPLERKLWESEPDAIHFAKSDHPHGDSVLRYEASPTEKFWLVYSAGDLDWSKHTSLDLDVRSPENGVELAIRIDDANPCKEYDDRFNRPIALSAGWNHLRIPVADMRDAPKHRKLDVSRIRRLIIWTERSFPQGFEVAALRLSDAPETR